MSKALTIVALHGFTGGGADFSGFAHLAAPEANWLCPDLPGHGESSHLACHPDDTVDLIQAHCSKINLEQQPNYKIVLGYSMGGRAALLHACRHQKEWDALILISCNPGIEGKEERNSRRKSDDELASNLSEIGVDAFIKQWQEQPLIQNQRAIRSDWYHVLQVVRSQHTTKGLAASLKHFGQGACPNLWPQISGINLPVLLISGSEDAKYSTIAKRMDLEINQSAHVSVTGAGHMPHLEKPEETAKEIQKFIGQIQGTH